MDANRDFLVRPEGQAPASVKESWRRIDAWFREHLPEVVSTLNSGASRREIDDFETAAKLTLPEDVRESFLIHNGQHEYAWPGAILGRQLLTLQDALSDLNEWRALVADDVNSDVDRYAYDGFTSYPEFAIQRVYANPNWIPLVGVDGDHLGLDLEPGPCGRVGQVINFGRNEDHKCVLAFGWAQLLEDIADEVESGSIVVRRNSESVLGISRAGAVDQTFHNYFRPWSVAKLPVEFQRASPVAVPVRQPVVVLTNAATEECRHRIEQFVGEMYAYELRWLQVRRIHELGLKLVEETPTGNSLEWLREPEFADAPWSASTMTSEQWTEGLARAKEFAAEHGIDKLVEIGGVSHFRKPYMSSAECEMYEKLQLHRYQAAACAERQEIIQRHCTSRPRLDKDCFVQHYPPRYTPDGNRVQEVRQVSADQIVVFLEPVGQTVTRFHLLRENDEWRIDLRDESKNGKEFRRVSV